MAIDPTDINWAIRIARQVSGDTANPPIWTDPQWTDALSIGTFGDALHPYYDPYLGAITYLLSPDTLNRRRLGDIEEEFQGTQGLVDHLRGLSERLRIQFGGALGPVLTSWGP